MYRVLVVDDEARIRSIIKKYAEFEGHQVIEAADGMEAVHLCRTQEFDIVVMDIMMPELDGFSACREIRKISGVPIIMLSARGEEYDRIHGFETGVDDYVVKPFSPKELMMRIDVILRRGQARETAHDILSRDGLVIDFTARKVLIDGQEVEMSPKEYDLLFYMAKNKGIVLSREKILSTIWGYEFFGDDRTVDTHIKMLRNSIEPYRNYIKTIWSIGYKLEVEEDA